MNRRSYAILTGLLLAPAASTVEQTEYPNAFKDARFDEQNRNLFAFASYNAGPGNISMVRTRAMKEGVNPDIWFNQVEHIAARTLGQETVRYVRNVFKYYVAYKLAQQTEDARAQAIERLKTNGREIEDDQ